VASWLVQLVPWSREPLGPGFVAPTMQPAVADDGRLHRCGSSEQGEGGVAELGVAGEPVLGELAEPDLELLDERGA
jgi:hypothetical protein